MSTGIFVVPFLFDDLQGGMEGNMYTHMGSGEPPRPSNQGPCFYGAHHRHRQFRCRCHTCVRRVKKQRSVVLLRFPACWLQKLRSTSAIILPSPNPDPQGRHLSIGHAACLRGCACAFNTGRDLACAASVPGDNCIKVSGRAPGSTQQQFRFSITLIPVC